MKTLLVLLILGGAGASPGITGDWVTPNKSVVRMYPCGNDICGKLVHISVAETKDRNNPQPSLRERPLCGLDIAEGFRMKDQTHAQGGHVYDPESGKTYRGTITAEGDTLKLRGYVGVPLFGRTETWHRANGMVAECAK